MQYVDADEVHSCEVETYEEAKFWAMHLKSRWGLPTNIVRRSLQRIIGDDWARLEAEVSRKAEP